MKRAAAGFSLMEVLLATLLLAMGMLVAFAAVRSAGMIGSRGEQIASANERMRAVQELLRRQLAGTAGLPFPGGDGELPHRFEGEPERMRFVSELPAYLGRGGPYLHELAVQEGDGGRQLSLALTLQQGGALLPEQPPRPPEVLVAGVDTVRFRYRGLDDATGQLLPWAERWEFPQRLPLLVSIEITPHGSKPWPPLRVTLPQATATGTP